MIQNLAKAHLRLRRHFEVFYRIAEHRWVVAQFSKHGITRGTQKTTNKPGFVAVIYGQRHHSVGFPADRANTTLLL